MSGVAVLRHLIATNSQVLAVIPATSIMAGDIPLKTALPAIGVTQISSIPMKLIRTDHANRLHTDRVQVTWVFRGQAGDPQGSGYAGVVAMGRLILTACQSTRGTVNGFSVDSITPDVEGPDFFDDASGLYSRSRDFVVKWAE